MTRSRPRSVVSASVSPSAYQASSESPDRLASGSTASERMWPVTGLGHSRPCQPTIVTATSTVARPATTRTGRHACRDGAGRIAAGVDGRASAPGGESTTGAAWSRACTALRRALVSAAGSVSRSAPSRLANSSYAATAPARSPTRSSRVIRRRSGCSSCGASCTLRRLHVAAPARSPRATASSPRACAPRHAASCRRARSWSCQRSKSGAPEMKNPSSSAPR